MSQRKGGPILLELMRSGGRESVRDDRPKSETWSEKPREKRVKEKKPKQAKPERRAPRPAPVSDDEGGIPWPSLFGGARSVRIPIGYLFVGAAFAMGLAFIGYVIGFGVAEGRLEAQERLEAARGIDGAVNDPLLTDVPLNPGLLSSNAQTAATNERSVEPLATPPPSTPATNSSSPASTTGGDTRQVGMNYFIVAREHDQEAERVAAFLRDNGVPAITVADSSPPWKQVVALIPFEPGALRSDEATAFRSRIHTLGQVWKRDHRGTTSFSDAYASKYQGG